ncbi:MAG: tetratricopeptide repeat protein [Luminiphilus sp.]|nr:tetratricopeptide repeat protein [Luminiphilus sp.]
MGLASRLCHHCCMMNKFHTIAMPLGVLLLLTACQSTLPGTITPPESQQETAGDTPMPEKAGSVASVESPPETPIPAASLYPLLQAEFLLRQRRLDEALEILTRQAMQLQDPELTRRALRLAEFRQNDRHALVLSMRLSDQDSDDGAAAVTAMGLLIRAGQPERALVFARTAKERGSRINAPALMVSWDKLGPDRQRRTAEAIESLAVDWPEDQDIAIALAYLYRAQNTPSKALDVLDPVLIESPDEERALLLWTQIQLDQKDNSPFKRMRAALKRAPDNETLRLQFARLLASTEQYDEARDQFAALLILSPRNGDYLFSLALIEIEAKQLDAAIANLRALVDLGQRPDEAYYYLGRVYEDRFEEADAIISYDRVGPSREFFDAVRRAAELRLNAGDTRDFQDGFRRTRRNHPGQAEQLYGLEAELLGEIDEKELAIAVYSEALDLFPESVSLLYGRAMTFEILGDIAGMENDLRAILMFKPNNATTLNALGYTLTVHTSRYQEAADLIERALALSPGEPAILDSLGWVYFKLGRFLQAADLLKEAYARFPDAEVAAHLGEVLWVSGKEQDALAIWRASLQQQPDATHVTQTLERLGVLLEDTAVE